MSSPSARTCRARDAAKSAAPLCLAVCMLLAQAACGVGGSGGSRSGSGVASGQAGSVTHVVLVVLENQNYADVVGSANAPYLNSLIAQGALATQYYANVHPSVGNYFMMTAGSIASTDDAYSGTSSPPDIVSSLNAEGKSWKVYVEGIPAAGYTGESAGSYVKWHNPLAYFTDVQGTAAANNIVPFSQLVADASGTLVNFAMIVGDIYDVGHDCAPTVTICTPAVELQQADAWLQSTLPQILMNASFAASGLLAVTFDESLDDNTDGGGQVVTVLLGTNVRAGYRAAGLYQHQSLLRLMLEAEGVSALPGASASAASMDQIWK